MPLQIFRDSPLDARAMVVYSAGIGVPSGRRLDADMGQFAVAHNVGAATALGTGGAGPCQIIVVHKAAGWGALGHYAAHWNPNMIVQGVRDMLFRLGGLPVSAVMFAAGQVAGGREQLHYEMSIVAQVRTLCAGARVIWPAAPANDVWGSCFYMPLAEQVGLFEDSPGGFMGDGDAATGMSMHQY